MSGISVYSENEFGDETSITIPLYEGDGVPVWEQELEEQSQPDLNAIGLRVPESLDVIRLPIEIPQSHWARWRFGPNDVDERFTDLGDDLFVAGYPYGYSAMGDTVMPVFLKRAVASTFTTNLCRKHLDSGAAPGMSGGPVFQLIDYEWKLVGIYLGVDYPDYMALGANQHANDKHAALGAFCDFATAHQHLQRAWLQEPSHRDFG